MQTVKNFITDMDGVLVKGKKLIPGADRFIARLEEMLDEYDVRPGELSLAKISAGATAEELRELGLL